MKAMTYTNARENLARTIDQVVDNYETIMITKGRDKTVVMLALDEWNSWQETMHLLSNPVNATKLTTAIQDLNGRERCVERDLIDVD